MHRKSENLEEISNKNIPWKHQMEGFLSYKDQIPKQVHQFEKLEENMPRNCSVCMVEARKESKNNNSHISK